MKKPVIFAILIAYIASIMIVQFFGLKIVEMKGNTYVTSIEISGFSFTKRDDITDGKYQKIVQLTDSSGKKENHYAGYFIPGDYDLSEESLKNNPNRIKIDYKINPYNASDQTISFAYDKDASAGSVYFDETTNEFIFLKPKTIYVILTARDGSTVKAEIGISLVS